MNAQQQKRYEGWKALHEIYTVDRIDRETRRPRIHASNAAGAKIVFVVSERAAFGLEAGQKLKVEGLQ